ncbi:hypothetical protein CNMCM6936_008158 [Aspergillus lentulus]|uniref:Demethylsterigmatocystin 6-O-methyltransferase n=1 Tax=Aspergillus lentulus TaxID=293939 RepID=A0AAN5YTZ2_ASPLE|nr:hypothetical protein CNMCM6069_006326 [Aspergillus lentulus]KAF4169466.1 hypothetical protein CNMCM6936_008158 [Aspergillus lentulus]KAF4206732.1 hypothetical protein CNMCM8927_004505 [Aspergillus lentulus]
MTFPPSDEDSSVEVSALVSNLKESIARYEKASDNTAALEDIISSSKMLLREAIDAGTLFRRFNFQPLLNACVRIAIEMQLFEKLPTFEPFTCRELAMDAGYDLEFTKRIVRGLAAGDVLEEVAENTYRQTKLSRLWASPKARDYTVHQWENFQTPIWSCIEYFQKFGFQSPTDPRNSPITFALGGQDKSLFDILEEDPRRLEIFNNAMKSLALSVTAYRFDKLQPGHDGILLVDVGGGSGYNIQEICSDYPNLKGRLVLQDIKGTVTHIKADGFQGRVDFQAYNFLEEIQPIKGAAAYLFKLVLHDWPDAYCHRILANLAPAMSRNSRLLICEKVLPEQSPDAHHVLSDLNMLFIGGKERTRAEWDQLLDTAGYVIMQIQMLPKPGYGMIEAALK